MKKRLLTFMILLALFWCAGGSPASGYAGGSPATVCKPAAVLNEQGKDTLATFIGNNPNAVDFNVIYEGTKLNLSADDEFLLVNLSVAHPALQMRFMMQRVSLYIDPSGKKKKRYEVVLPSAMDVKDVLGATAQPHSNDQTTNSPDDQDERPDIRPLIGALNKRGAEFHSDGSNIHLSQQLFYIEHDRENERLNYYILIPKAPLMQDPKLSEKWTLGIFSINDFANMPPPEQQGDDGMMPPPMGSEDEPNIQELMQSDIREWVKFSIDDVNNANLKINDIEKPLDAHTWLQNDSLTIDITVREIETQLTFLMQGLVIHLDQPDSLTFSFPAAPLVRSKVHRHPNEVKAVLTGQGRQQNQTGRDTVNKVMRPDVQPLVSALNDTTATITLGSITSNQDHTRHVYSTRSFNICVDREKALMIFTAKLPQKSIKTFNRTIQLILTSQPMGKMDLVEYEGHRLSGEQAPQPQGLGEGLRRDNADSRSLHISLTSKIDY